MAGYTFTRVAIIMAYITLEKSYHVLILRNGLKGYFVYTDKEKNQRKYSWNFSADRPDTYKEGRHGTLHIQNMEVIM